MNNNKLRNIIIVVVLVILVPVSVMAWDFGFLIDQKVEASGTDGDHDIRYQLGLVPYLSILAGDSSEIFLSGGFNAIHEQDDWGFYPELLRSTFTWSSDSAKIQAGRMPYTDPLDFVANGLFDGAQFSYNSRAGVFSVGAWYTGLLNKEKANILITTGDREEYDSKIDMSSFSDTYFASRRFVASLGWEHPAIAEILQLRMAVTGQIDFNDNDDKLHSEYFTLKARLPVKRFLFELGGGVQIMQVQTPVKDDVFIGLAGDFGMHWLLPTSFDSRLSLSGQITSGRSDSNDLIAAFIPINTKSVGNVLNAELTGISIFNLNYTARLHRTLSATLSAAHLVRSDLGTYREYPAVEGSDNGYFLGTEFFGRVTWSPVSDLRFELGGGVFTPALGDAGPDREPMWRLDLSLVFALF